MARPQKAEKWGPHGPVNIEAKPPEEIFTAYTDSRGYLPSMGGVNAGKRCTIIIHEEV